MARTALVVVSLAALAAAARAAPKQITSSPGDTVVQRFGATRSGLVALSSNGDLTPGDPGNADGSAEVYLLQLATGSLRQVTASAADSSSVRVTRDGRIVISSRGDLTPGAPGNGDGSFEAWLSTPATATAAASLVQMTSSAEDSFFQTFWDDEDRAFFASKGDLTPGAPGNADGANEVYVYDVATGTLTQLTNAPQASLIRAICGPERCGVVESGGDLTPGAPGNADHSTEVFLLDLDTLAFEQVTSSLGTTHYRGQDAAGRRLAFESTGDIVPGGNADASQEVYVYDRKTRTLTQLTHSAGASYFAGFVPRSRLVAVESREDLVPASASSPGNAGRSNEIYTVDVRSNRTVQHTASAGDSFLYQFATARSSRAAIVSTGDLTTGASVGHDEIWIERLGAKRRKAKRMTDGTHSVRFGGVDAHGHYLAFESTDDLVPGGNADGSREVFVTRTRHRPKLRQVTSGTVFSEFAGFAGDGRTLLVNSRDDLDRSVGNSDGSFEVFRLETRRPRGAVSSSP
jgi:hypothetical protein